MLSNLFYLTMKVHKNKPNLTRPVISCSGSVLYFLAVWVNHYLQQVALRQPTYLKSSRQLKEEILQLNIPTSAKLFTADAVSMYTNIITGPALQEIGMFLHQRSKKYSVPCSALSEALGLVMQNNVFQFGDLCFKQLQEIAMGTPAGCSYANLFYAIHERRIYKK